MTTTLSSTERPPTAGSPWRALAALAALLGLVLGVPAGLVALVDVLPVELSILGPGLLARPDDGRLLLLVLVALAWLGWAVVVSSLLVEVASLLRQVPTPALPGLAAPQRLAAVLISSLLATSPGGLASAQPTPVGLGSLLVVEHQQPSASMATVVTPVPKAPEEVRQEGPTVVTQRLDTLWMLAELHLGSGERYTEILALNRGVPQPDGRALRDDGRLYPGWRLRLPVDARTEVARPDRHVVRPHDTLWEIAADELGDPQRYPEVFAANRGDLQPDGRRLEDPDLILPGWVLEMPAAGTVQEAPTGVDAPAGGAGAGSTPAADVPALDRGNAAPTGSAVPGTGTAPLPRLDRSPDEAPSASDASAPEAGPPSTSSPPTPSTPRQRGGSEAPAASNEAPPERAGDAGSAAGFVLPAGGTLSGLLLGALAAELVRRRRQFQRHRRPGERMPTPGPGPREVESQARAAAAEPTGDLLARAVAALAASAGAHGALPRVRLVRVSPDRMRLHLAEGELPDPFRRVDAGVWEVATGDLALGEQQAPWPYPGLVSVGIAGPEVVLLDLAEVGVLQVTAGGDAAAGRRAPSEAGRGDAASGWAARREAALAVGALGQAGRGEAAPDVGARGAATHGDATPADVVRAMVAELALGHGRAERSVTVCADDLTILAALEAGDVAVEADLDRVERLLARGVRRTSRGTAPQVPDPLEVVVTDRPLEVHVPGRAGVGVVTTSLLPEPAGAVLRLASAGLATLEPDGVRLMPVSLSPSSAQDLVELLAATDLPDEDPRADAALEPSPTGVSAGTCQVASAGEVGTGRSEVANARPGGPPRGSWAGDSTDGRVQAPKRMPSAGSGLGRGLQAPTAAAALVSATGSGDPAAATATAGMALPAGGDGVVVVPATAGTNGPAESHGPATVPHIQVLGDVRVLGAAGKAESTRIGRLAETAAFVLLNPDSRPSALQSALWPDRRSNPDTCRQMISRTRTWLGRTADGEPYLMPFAETEGLLRLRPEVTSDWGQFQRLAEEGLDLPEDTVLLAKALSLVRGRPFGAVAARELPWADLHLNTMISLITDVAHELAVRQERVGAVLKARDAVFRGLQTGSESAALLEVLARLE